MKHVRMGALVGMLGTLGMGCGGGGGDNPGGGACRDLPPASVNADGVLSAYPSVSYEVDFGYRIDTVGVKVTDDGDTRGPLFELFAEVTNTGSTTRCGFLPDVYLDFTELISLVRADKYYSDLGILYDCIAPGETAVLTALERGLDETNLVAGSTLSITMEPFNFGTYTRATDGPYIADDAIAFGPDPYGLEGYGVDGTLTMETTIYNYGLRAFPRDSRGVIVDELLAFPGDLDTLSAGSSIEFSTERTGCDFPEYRAIHSWLRVNPSGLRIAEDPESAARRDAIDAREASVEALRGR
jgi:hypothetical protein